MPASQSPTSRLHDSELDAVRRLAWVSDGRLCALFASQQAKSVAHPALPFSVSALIGQPVQHEDGGTSPVSPRNLLIAYSCTAYAWKPMAPVEIHEQLGVLPPPGVSAITARETPVRIAVEVPSPPGDPRWLPPAVTQRIWNEIEWRVVANTGRRPVKAPGSLGRCRVLSLGFDGSAITGILRVGDWSVFWRAQKEGELVIVSIRPCHCGGDSVVGASLAFAHEAGEPCVAVRTVRAA